MKFTLIIISIIFSGILLAQEVPAKYQKLWQNINEAEDESARKELLKELKKSPKDPWLNFIAGHAYLFSEPEKAQSYFEKTIAIDSTIGPAYYGLALTLDDSLDIDREITLYGKAIKFDPGDGFSHLYRGGLYLKKGLPDLAMADAEAAKKCELTDPLAIDGLLIEVMDYEGKTKELHSFVKNGGYSDIELMWNQSTIDIVIRVYEELNQPQDVCKMCRMIQKEYSMFEKDPPAEIQEKLKKCN